MAPRKTLGSRDTPCALDLQSLMRGQPKALLVNWALDFTQARILPVFLRRCPGDARPRMALDAARDWLAGRVKLPFVRDIILNQAHAAAREMDKDPAAQAAARAAAQAASSVHAVRHALGALYYGAAALAYDRLGTRAAPAAYQAVFEQLCAEMAQALREAIRPSDPR